MAWLKVLLVSGGLASVVVMATQPVNSLTNGPAFKKWYSNPLPSAALCGGGNTCGQQYRVWADINGDGWDDLFVLVVEGSGGSPPTGSVRTFIRDSSAAENELDLVEATGAANPLHGIDVTGAPAFADLGKQLPVTTWICFCGMFLMPFFSAADGDGDLDCLMSQGYGVKGFKFYQNVGTKQSASFTLVNGNSDPFNFVTASNHYPSFVDLNGD